MTLLVEAGWGGLVQAPDTITWTDITEFVDTVQGVSISRGASDERSETQPGQASLTLDNSDGRFTPGNTGSPYYPFVRRNAPIRVSKVRMPERTGSAPYPLAMLADDFDDGQINSTLWPGTYGGCTETGGRARIPVVVGAGAGYQSARTWTLAESQLTAQLARVPAETAAGAGSMYVTSTTPGTRLGWVYFPTVRRLTCEAQTDSDDPGRTVLEYSPTDYRWLRVREAGGVTYWESSSNGWQWTVRRSIATPAWVASQTQRVDFQVFPANPGSTTDYFEWDLVGAQVWPRLHGMVNEFPVDWEGLNSKVTVTATDLFKRLNRLPPLKSPLAEEILRHDLPGVYDECDAYYPLSEPSDSVSAGDLSGRGSSALNITQVGIGGTLEFGTDGVPATEESAVNFAPASASAGKYLTANTGASFEALSNVGTLVVEAWIRTSTPGRAILGLYERNLDHQIVLSLTAGGVLAVESTADNGPLYVSESTSPNLADGNWHHIVFDAWGGTNCWVDGVQRASYLFLYYPYGLRYLHVGGFRGGRLFNGQIAHVAIYHTGGLIGDALADHYTAGATAYAGETADARIQRLARYAGLTELTISGSTHDPVAGQGGGAGVVSRMREIEATESGRLFVARDGYNIVYQSRDVRYNPSPSLEAFTIDYADLEPGTRFADDDQKMINSVQASRPGGATQRASDPDSINAYGPYEAQLDILKASDNSVLDAAYWLVSRYADPQPELREVAIEAYTMPNYEDILGADISSYFSVTNLPEQAPALTLRVTIEGYTETIKDRSHLIQFHTSTSLTDSVWVLDDPVYSVLDTSTRLAY